MATRRGLVRGAIRRRPAKKKSLDQLILETEKGVKLAEILGEGLAALCAECPADRASIIVTKEGGFGAVRVVATRERVQGIPPELDLNRYPEIGLALSSREPVFIRDAQRDPLLRPVRSLIAPVKVRSIVVQPLLSQGELLGLLFLHRRRLPAFSVRERALARKAAAVIAGSILGDRHRLASLRLREEFEAAFGDRLHELGQANRRLKENLRAKDELIAICSHDLRAPLNVLLGHAELLQEAGPSADADPSVNAIAKQGRRILELVESLLDRARGERAKISLEPKLLDLEVIAREVCDELGILAGERKVRLLAESSGGLVVVGDAVKLRQVVQNLVANAVHHCREQGRVVVAARRQVGPDGPAAWVSVTDEGPGIHPRELGVVFDRFRPGSMGLAICKEFVELHGGEIWVESPASGGTTFTFALPLASSSKDPSVRSTGTQARATVLVVEDDSEVLARAVGALRPAYAVEIARDGTEGLARARVLRPDLVVTDVLLPGIDGLELAHALRASTDTASVPILLLSARPDVVDRVRGLNLGAVDFLIRPFEPLELAKTVERALALAGAERELARSQALLRRGGQDPETGFFGPEAFRARLDEELARSRRHSRPMALLLLNPQGPVGALAQRSALVMRRTLRVPDVIGHLGEGRFVIILPECPKEGAEVTGARLALELMREVEVPFGYAVVSPDAEGSLLATLETLTRPRS